MTQGSRTRRALAPNLALALLACAALLTLSPRPAAAAPRHGHSRPGPVLRAARAKNRADRVLVASAVSYERCLRAHRRRPAPCASLRTAVQRAGSTLARIERRLGALAYAGGHLPLYAARRARPAPRLAVSGRSLSWSPEPHAHVYLLLRKVPGQAIHFSLVFGTTDATPPPVPGESVGYSVRALGQFAVWSNEVQIAYAGPQPPAGGPGSGSGNPGPAPEGPAGKGSGQPVSEGEQVDTQAAPTVTVSGTTLSWNAIGGVSAYIVESYVAGGAPVYSPVSGTSLAPAPQPGKTVHYLVRTAVTGSAWSADATIAWPAEAPHEQPHEPPHEQPREQPQPEGPSGFQPGLNSGTNLQLDVPGAAMLGAHLVRVEFEIGESAGQLENTIAAYAAKGIRVEPLAGFYGRLPSSGEARNMATWAQAYGPGGTFWSSHPGTPAEPIAAIEFGNETSYGYQYGSGAGTSAYSERAETYARRLKEGAEAIAAAGSHVGVLAQADDWTGDWVGAMFRAVPNLGSYVGGWTIHPYGPTWRGRLEALLRQTAEHGAPSTIPVDITEWGLATDNGHCLTENYGWNSCMSYAEAGATAARVIGEIRATLGSRMGAFMIYQVRDQSVTGTTNNREAYFGVLQHELQSKGPFTAAVQAILAL